MQTDQPNVLFIVADDLNAWIGALGRQPDVKTPHIDRLARQGTLFARAYCSAPYCNASRMGFFTGRPPVNLGIYSNETFWDRPDRPLTLMEHFRNAGYHLVGAGKVFHGTYNYAEAGKSGATEAHWRPTENREFVWDAFCEVAPEPLPTARPVNGMFDFTRFDEVKARYHLFDWGPFPDEMEGRMPDRITLDYLKGFLADAPADKPFFCAAGFYKPHLPWHVPQRFFDLYDRDKISLPPVKWDDLDDVPPIGRKWAINPPDHAIVVRNNQWRHAVHAYLACISYLDELIGELLDALDESGQANNTIVVLCGDNGFHLGEKLHWRKFALWEEATRVAMIVSAPGRGSGLQVHAPVSLIDLFPTLMQLGGLPLPEGIDSQSLLPLMDKAEPAKHRSAIMTWTQGCHSVRQGPWRLIRYRDNTYELYDHRLDPNEWTNLAGEQRFAGVLARLDGLLPPAETPSTQN